MMTQHDALQRGSLSPKATSHLVRSKSLPTKVTYGRFRRSSRRGAILMLFAVLLPIILMIAGFGLYIAHAQLTRSELRTATDFAARAGAKRMSIEQTENAAFTGAIEAASRNTVAGQPLVLDRSQIILGQSVQNGGTTGRFTFTPGAPLKNAVEVRANVTPVDGVTGFFQSLSNVSSQTFRMDAIATNLDRDLCLVIDRSGSMTQPVNSTNNGTAEPCGPLPPNSRFAALARAVDAFIFELNQTPQNELVCLVSYSSNNTTACRCCPSAADPCGSVAAGCPGPVRYTLRFTEASIHSTLSPNATALTAPIQEMLQTGINGGTAIGSGLRFGLQAVKGTGARPFAVPTIVLMTDGNHNTGVNPVIVAQQAVDENVVVHTVTFSRGANQTLMRQVAAMTGGKHFHADTEADLSETFREIARTLPVMLTN